MRIDGPRFFATRGAVWREDAGFLFDPTTETGKIFNPDIAEFDALESCRCLVVLGEPGIGKSHWYAERRDRTTAQRAIFKDLKAVDPKEIFARSEVDRWRNGDGDLELWLDSFDEGQIYTPNLGDRLAEQLGDQPCARLKLRILCRASEWSSGLETGLKRLWPDAFGCYVMAPLRYADVQAAAASLPVDPERFLAAVRDREVGALAARPITLQFLLRQFQESGDLPNSRKEIYERGCAHLAEEARENIRRNVDSVSANQRLAIAERIATLTLLSNRPFVWTGLESAKPSDALAISDIAGGRETAAGIEFEVTEALVRRTLDSGLFAAAGADRVAWNHLSYAEFLAARRVARARLTPRQRRQLFQPGASGRLPATATEQVAWLADFDTSVRDELLTNDPLCLLRSDCRGVAADDIERFVETILQACETRQIAEFPWDAVNHLRKLGHPRLAQQLGPYIRNESARPLTRILAIEIAEANGLESLRSDLVTVAIDANVARGIAESAAGAVVRIGVGDEHARFRSLLQLPYAQDRSDELLGSALEALWPHHLSIEEVLDSLREPHDPNFYGTYGLFLASLPKTIEIGHLVAVLDWMTNRSAEWGPFDVSNRFRDLSDRVVLLACGKLRQAGIREALAQWIAPRLNIFASPVSRDHTKEFKELLAQQPDERRQLAQAIVPFVPTDRIAWQETGDYLLKADFEFILDRLVDPQEVANEEKWFELARYGLIAMGWGDEPEFTDILYRRRGESDAIERLWKRVCGPVMLDSEDARSLRDLALTKEELAKRIASPDAAGAAPVEERVRHWLERCESGEQLLWCKLYAHMCVATGAAYLVFHPNARETPGWKAVDEDVRSRIVAQAAAYLQAADPADESWLDGDSRPWTVVCGVAALELLLAEASNTAKDLPSRVWEKWAAAVLADAAPAEALLREVHLHAPGRFLEVLRRLIERRISDGSFPAAFVRSRLRGGVWDSEIEALLLGVVGDRPETNGALADLAPLLAESGSDATVGALLEAAETSDPARASAIWTALLRFRPRESLDRCKAAVENSPELRSGVLAGLKSTTFPDNSAFAKFSEEQLGTMFEWSVGSNEPPEADPLDSDEWSAHYQTDDWLRAVILGELVDRGTEDGFRTVRGLAARYPHMAALPIFAERAESEFLQRAWQPIEPSDVRGLLDWDSAGVVRSADDLMDMVIEALERLEKKLHGETPEVESLWQARREPQDEETFSNVLKNRLSDELRQAGVILNREVEIRRTGLAGPGEEPDLKIDAVRRNVPPGTVAPFSVIVEVKGCWHDEVYTAMKTQLVDRYLRDNQTRHGLYLVGWFGQPVVHGCRPLDGKKLEIGEAREYFERQAAELSTGDLRIRAFVLNCQIG